jgi:hypothetical protein
MRNASICRAFRTNSGAAKHLWLSPGHFAGRDLLRMTSNSRVGKWRGGLGSGLSVADAFGCRCLTSSAMLRFHFPLVEPDRRFSRIRLSDKAGLTICVTLSHAEGYAVVVGAR